MTQEDKNLLLKDLCARLPYGVKVQSYSYEDDIKTVETLYNIDSDGYMSTLECDTLKNITKPYLFPLSSMTEEQKYDFYCRFIENDCDFADFKEFYLDGGMWHKLSTSLDDIEAIIDWFHKKHFDWRGLIPMGLANDATGLNIY